VQSLTDCTVYHTWKRSAKDTTPALEIAKTEHDSEYETIIEVTPAMSSELDLGTYYYDFAIKTADDKIITDKKMQGHFELIPMISNVSE
jgi:hypothetical protein